MNRTLNDTDLMRNQTHRRSPGWLTAVCAAVILSVGCAGGEVETDPEGDVSNDTDVTADAGADGDTRDSDHDGGDASDDGGDTDDDAVAPPANPTPTLAPSAGGATVETSNHKIRLIVAPRGGAQTVETANHRIRLGAGQVQHGQERR